MLGLFAKVQYVWEDSIDFYQRAKVLLFQIPSVIFPKSFIFSASVFDPTKPSCQLCNRLCERIQLYKKKRVCENAFGKFQSVLCTTSWPLVGNEGCFIPNIPK